MAEWEPLRKHYETLKQTHLSTLLADSARNKALLATFEDIVFDFTHEKVTQETVDVHFSKLVETADLRSKLKDLFSGKHINFTEDRPVLHTILRAPAFSDLFDHSIQFIRGALKDVHQVLNNIKVFSESVRSGEFKGASGKSLTELIVIGIGGSYLSIELVYEALRSHPRYIKESEGRKIRFLANVDPIDFQRATAGLDCERVLVVVNSKTFTTAETMLNAKSVKQWLIKEYAKKGITDQALISACHIAACSTNLVATSKFGIPPKNVFGFWNFVGGRFSVWSAVGVLPLGLHFGYQVVEQFLKGGHSIDKHLISETNVKMNIPLMLGLIGFYRNTIMGYPNRAIIPYCQALCKFVPHIQQLDMESNGKRTSIKNQLLPYSAAGINFGEPGTNGQHSFFQLLHQGRVTPVEFIGFTRSQQPWEVQGEAVKNHDELMSNFFSQPDALAIGKAGRDPLKQASHLDIHRDFPGDRPSSSLMFIGELNAYKCGQLLAIYEHRTSVQGFLWGLNSYDQFGVELGKVLANQVRLTLKQGAVGENEYNSATQNMLQIYLSYR